MRPNAARAGLGPPVSDTPSENDDDALGLFSDEDLERYARHLILPEMGAVRQLADTACRTRHGDDRRRRR